MGEIGEELYERWRVADNKGDRLLNTPKSSLPPVVHPRAQKVHPHRYSMSLPSLSQRTRADPLSQDQYFTSAFPLMSLSLIKPQKRLS